MRFVLVHGAWHGAWCWEPVIAELEAAGHSVDAPDLPGSGDDQTPLDGVTLDAYAERICEVLGTEAGPAVLVGHSMGGIAVAQAAERCPERVASLVYVAAFLPGTARASSIWRACPRAPATRCSPTWSSRASRQPSRCPPRPRARPSTASATRSARRGRSSASARRRSPRSSRR